MEYQVTIKEKICIRGKNIFFGNNNYVIFHPSYEDTGLVFKNNGIEINVNLNNAKYCRKSIKLDNGKTKVYLVEHLLSAVYALGIDNLVIELSDGTCPTLNNCAGDYFLALKNKRISQSKEKKFWKFNKLERIINHKDFNKPDLLKISQSESFMIDYFSYYPHKVVGGQRMVFEVDENHYENNIMNARSPTFVLNDLFKNILLTMEKIRIHGINDKNSLLITSKNSENYGNSNGFGVRYGGYEFVRHKVLDILGTLALTGKQFKNTSFKFNMTGHEFDLYALRKLFDESSFELI